MPINKTQSWLKHNDAKVVRTQALRLGLQNITPCWTGCSPLEPDTNIIKILNLCFLTLQKKNKVLQMQNIKTYVIHVRGNKERENYIRNELKKFNIDFEFILNGNMDDMTNEDLNKYFKDDFKIISPRSSCTIKHFFVYERMVENNIPCALVFEDDIELFSDFQTVFDQSLNEIKKEKLESCVISYESSTQEFISSSEELPGKVIYQKPHGRCAGAYLIDLTAAKKILDYGIKNKSNVCMDWFHNEIANKDLIKIYWCHPTIAEQQSHNGKIQSLLDEKKQGKYFRFKYFIQKVYKQKILSRFR